MHNSLIFVSFPIFHGTVAFKLLTLGYYQLVDLSIELDQLVDVHVDEWGANL